MGHKPMVRSFFCFICQLCSVSQNNKMTLVAKGGFHTHLCRRVCLRHTSGVSDNWSYFQGGLFLLIDEQTPGYERDVLFKQRQWSQHCKWNSGLEEHSHTSGQKKCWQVCKCLRVCICVSSAHPDNQATLWLYQSMLTHNETLKSKQIHEDFLILCWFWNETLTKIAFNESLFTIIIAFILH